ncbi:MAG: hypothetical protein ACFFB5_03975 [Promethearchaeota archaeon]
MIETAIQEELNIVIELLDECLEKMDDIMSPKAKNILWRVFFPAGQFMEQKSSAKLAASILVNIDERLREMVEVLEDRKHSQMLTIRQLLDLNLIEMAERLVDLPERAQYMIPQIEAMKKRATAIMTEDK